MKLTIQFEKSVIFSQDIDTCFRLLSDIPFTATCFPKVEELIDLGNNTYQWDLEPQGPPPYSVQTIYACRYRYNTPDKISWEPIPEIGNAFFGGSWTLSPLHNRCKAQFILNGEMDFPIPEFAEIMAKPLIRSLFNTLLNDFLDALQQRIASI